MGGGGGCLALRLETACLLEIYNTITTEQVPILWITKDLTKMKYHQTTVPNKCMKQKTLIKLRSWICKVLRYNNENKTTSKKDTKNHFEELPPLEQITLWEGKEEQCLGLEQKPL